MKICLRDILREPSVAENVKLEGWGCRVEKIFKRDGKFWKVDLLPSEEFPNTDSVYNAAEVVPVNEITRWVEV
jgi:hypothetical protein